ncbi:LysR family transcriptional regulator [Kitasatospora indigofera]|uniref:LysR family transcriptional regulator n=1 Tax=Kitasatospora indigofera TaxID=67307 RepID=UPI0036A6CAD8
MAAPNRWHPAPARHTLSATRSEHSLDWGDLTAFRAVAEELSFTRAAARLRLSQPALSQRVRRLEKELGARLLQRTTRTVTLTPAGRALVGWVVSTENAWDEVRQEVAFLADRQGPARAAAPAPTAVRATVG